MFTHDQIWAAIDRLAESRGFSPSGLARQAGLDPTAFNRSKRVSPNGKPRWPSTESVSKILAVTGSTMSDLFALMDDNDSAGNGPLPLMAYNEIRAGRITADTTEIFTLAMDRGGDAVFAVKIEDDRLHPLIRSGATIVAERDIKLKAQDRVLLYSREHGLKGGIFMASQKKAVTILLPGPTFTEITFTDADLEWTARILWSSQ